MIIHKLNILSFGKFKNKTISFENGLNYIYGENEAGKSTVMAFIKAMLYGFGSGVKSDRARYAPWDGTKLCGEMEVTLSDGKRIIIHREQGKTKAHDVFYALDAVTGETVSFEPETEIGIGEGAFMKTVFIPQMQADISGGDAELTEKLLNLVTSGDADTGYEEAKKYLAEEMRNLKALRGDGGRINDLKKEITELENALREAEEGEKSYFRYIAEERTLFEETEKLKAEKESLEGKLLGAKASAAFSAHKKALEEAEKAEKNLREAEESLSVAREKEKALSAFKNEPDGSLFEKEDASSSPEKGMGVWPLYVAGVMVVLSAILIILSALIPGLVLLAFGAVSLFLGIKNHNGRKETARKIAEKEEKRKKALEVYGCLNLSEYTEKRAEFLSLSETISVLEKNCAFALGDAEMKRGEVKRCALLAAEFEGVTSCDISEKELAWSLQSVSLSLTEKERELISLRGILKGAQEGKKAPDLIESEISLKREELLEAQGYYEALSLAAETLEDVFRELSNDFTPRINKQASAYLSVLTGKEENILLDKKYAVTMAREDHRPLVSFSGGTVEQAFLAVRLSIAALVLEGNFVPVFLDDAFIQYDEKREENAFSLLLEIAKERQVILFSCRKRETNAAHIIEL